MKKIFILLCVVCIVLMSFGFAACGRGKAKVTGIMVGIGTDKNSMFVANNPLADNDTLIENDYILQSGQTYLLGVTYTQYGGSIICAINTDAITLKYDDEVLEIVPPEENQNITVYYNLICKKEVDYAAIIVEVGGEYSCTVIISTK